MSKEEVARRIIELRKSGLGMKVIAKQLDVSRDTVRYHCRKNGLGGVLVTYEKVKCESCRKTFQKKSNRQKFCSDDCVISNGASCVFYLNKECKECDKSFKPKAPNQLYCTEKCRGRVNDKKSSRELSRQRKYAHLNKSRVCNYCNTEYTIKGLVNSNETHCSKECIENDNPCDDCNSKYHQDDMYYNQSSYKRCRDCHYERYRQGERVWIDHGMYIKEVKRVHGNSLQVVSDYRGADQPIKLKCLECSREWSRAYARATIRNEQEGCVCHSQSRGEKTISKWLSDNGIEFKSEHTFSNLRYKNLLQLDFYLPNHNLIIEYDGEFHYEEIPFGDTEEYRERAKENLKLNRIRDNIKNKYAVENGIEMLRIPYWSLDEIEKILEMEVMGNRIMEEIAN